MKERTIFSMAMVALFFVTTAAYGQLREVPREYKPGALVFFDGFLGQNGRLLSGAVTLRLQSGESLPLPLEEVPKEWLLPDNRSLLENGKVEYSLVAILVPVIIYSEDGSEERRNKIEQYPYFRSKNPAIQKLLDLHNSKGEK